MSFPFLIKMFHFSWTPFTSLPPISFIKFLLSTYQVPSTGLSDRNMADSKTHMPPVLRTWWSTKDLRDLGQQKLITPTDLSSWPLTQNKKNRCHLKIICGLARSLLFMTSDVQQELLHRVLHTNTLKGSSLLPSNPHMGLSCWKEKKKNISQLSLCTDTNLSNLKSIAV